MTNSLPGRRGRAPRTDPEWAREMQRRLTALEQSTTVRVGSWVLNGTEDGHLTATTTGRSAVLTGITDISQIATLVTKLNDLEKEVATKADKVPGWPLAGAVRVGPWVLSAEEDGTLVATAGGRRVVLAELPGTDET